MGRKLYISDTHFLHGNVLKFDSRPFFGIDEMGKEMIKSWNEVVDKGDIVYILGDFCWSPKEDEWIKILSAMNGAKVLITGNHDIKQIPARLRKHFQDIKPYKEITDNGRKVIMSHYPILFYRGSYNPNIWMLHGHTHNTEEQKYVEKWTREIISSDNLSARGQIMNVGCMRDYMDYKPRTLDEIIEAYNQMYKGKIGRQNNE